MQSMDVSDTMEIGPAWYDSSRQVSYHTMLYVRKENNMLGIEYIILMMGALIVSDIVSPSPIINEQEETNGITK